MMNINRICQLPASNQQQHSLARTTGKTQAALQLFGFLEPTILLFTSNENRFASVQFSNTMTGVIPIIDKQIGCINMSECPVALLD